jgi:pimeloyl-ACP methyl ester carboxylesterase
MLEDDSTAKDIVGFTRVDRIFVFGHSIGGATTASSLLADNRIRGGINFDGDMLGPVVTSGVDKPLFLIGQPRAREQGPSWNQTWDNLRGPGMMMQIAGITHQSFIDAPLLVTLRGIPEGSETRINAALGTIDGRRMAAVVIELVVAVLEFVFYGAEDQLCQVPVRFCDVTILETKGIGCP